MVVQKKSSGRTNQKIYANKQVKTFSELKMAACWNWNELRWVENQALLKQRRLHQERGRTAPGYTMLQNTRCAKGTEETGCLPLPPYFLLRTLQSKERERGR